MDHHLGVGAAAEAPGYEEMYYSGRRPNGIYIPRFRQLKSPGSLGYAGGFNLQGIVGRPMLPPHMDSVFGLTGHGEILPHADNQVRLASRKDRLGVPIPSVAIRLRENDRRLLADQVDTQMAMMKAAGLSIDFLISPLGLKTDGRFMPNAKWYERLMFRLAYKRSADVIKPQQVVEALCARLMGEVRDVDGRHGVGAAHHQASARIRPRQGPAGVQDGQGAFQPPQVHEFGFIVRSVLRHDSMKLFPTLLS